MRYILFPVFLLILFGCDSGSFDKDKRQIMAKDALRSSLPARSRGFDIIDFKEDTLPAWKDLEHPIRYSMNYVYTDSGGVVQQRHGSVIFAPDGRSVITTQTVSNP